MAYFSTYAISPSGEDRHSIPGVPHAMSIHEKYQRSPLNPAFASALSELVRDPVSLWIHGYTHKSMDYMLAGTRVVCNPRGYLPDEPNPGFEPGLVIELPASEN